MKAKAKPAVHDEMAMRESTAANPKSIEELSAYIKSLTDGTHDYGTCVYAMSLAATAAFNYVASNLGVTGFQASCADLDILRRTRSLKGPFMLIKAEDALYPQYDLRGRLDEALTEWEPWLGEEAAKLLAERDDSQVSPSVRAHWKKLAKSTTPPETLAALRDGSYRHDNSQQVSGESTADGTPVPESQQHGDGEPNENAS